MWDRWVGGPDSCVGVATLPLTALTNTQPGKPAVHGLVMAVDSGACERQVVHASTQPRVEVRVVAEQVVVGPAPADHLQGAVQLQSSHPDRLAGATEPLHMPSGLRARLETEIIAACGLQAAVVEAAAWLGGGASVLGHARRLGPHPYALLTLFPGEGALRAAYPTLRTPFQVC